MRLIYTLCGFICLLLGGIGVVLPILPTAPFLLLTAFFFAKSSKKLNDWFISTKIYKNHLDSYVKEKSMTLKTKISILMFASIMLLFPLVFSDNFVVKSLIVCLIILKYYYFLFRIKTISEYKKRL